MTREADAELQTWGRMLFSRAKPGPRHPGRGVRIPTPDVVRREIRLAVKRAPQVMVKVTGGGRGMAAGRRWSGGWSARGRSQLRLLKRSWRYAADCAIG